MLIMVQFDPEEIARMGLPDQPWAEANQRLCAALALPDGAAFSETAMSRMQRGDDRKTIDFSRWMLLTLKLPKGDQAALHEVVNRLNGHPLILRAEPDYDACGWKPPAPEPPQPPSGAVIPNDPLFAQQYYLSLIHAPEAWSITTGSADILVAVIDTGCSSNLPDLAGRLLPGYDFVEDHPGATDAAGHGTSIAALIGAEGQNGAGIAGLDWHCRILPIHATEGGAAVWAQALEYAVREGARIINISGKLDLPSPNPFLDAALEQAAASGAIIVASAGNQDQDHLAWPASSPLVIAVGAEDGFGQRWQDPVHRQGSNYGPGLDITAPGRDIVTLGVDGKRAMGAGTSASAALVSGACALMLAVNPALTPAQVRQILRDTAEKTSPPDDGKDGYSPNAGYGRLNVYKAVRAAQACAREK